MTLGPRIYEWVRFGLGYNRDERKRRATRESNMEAARAYHDAVPAAERAGAIDDRTWADLDLDDVFMALDYTESEPGRQYLYHLLRTPRASDDRLHRLDAAARWCAGAGPTVDRVRAALGRLRDPRAKWLHRLFLRELPERPRLWWVFPILTCASVACLALLGLRPDIVLIWVGICVVNVVVQLVSKPWMTGHVGAIHEVPALLRVATMLGAMDLGVLAPQGRVLAESASALRSLRRATRWLMFEPGQTNDVVAAVYEYVNLLFLLDVNAFVFSLETLRASRERIRALFDAVACIDAAQGLAAWRATLAQWCNPTFTAPCKAMRVEGLVHPLVENAVPNSLTIDGASVLVTGSNMAGKTTFVRALGVNAVLAQTLCTACATAWTSPFLEVRTSIGRDDSVLEGKSYYLAEVESVLSLVRAKDDGRQHLFLLDETFRGTNTTERVAAAFAVLRYLNQGLDLVVVATHDLEVIDLLGDEYVPHHFREQIANDELTFDYLLQPGPSSTRNAIALLRFMRYPAQVLADAEASIDWQTRRGATANPSDNGGTA
ncbi:MAG: MutS-related protein [Gemmatimonadaceae bacterium]